MSARPQQYFIENKEKCLCIGNNKQCVAKIHNRVGCTCFIYFLDDPKQLFSIFLKNAQRLHFEE